MPDQPDKPLAADAYAALAARYAARIDTKPHNAYYERPAILALLPDVNGQRVLDAGCGTGLYAEWMLDHGAEVVGVDASPEMLAFARQRVGARCDLHEVDLSRPLDFLADGAFDLVFSSLVMHYIEDWHAPFATFYRALRPGGLFVFSTGHPFAEYTMSANGNYFAVEQVGMPWRGFGGEPVYMPFYRRPLGLMTAALSDAGFVIEQITEPLPTEDFRRADPEDYAELMREPGFMCFRARKD
ncbi:MAG: class I SAM-dependent methyltransferase [Anaerolineae bacterium]|nr:class I SAM-dependent methyltransferase [Anaerolineae bacterium]